MTRRQELEARRSEIIDSMMQIDVHLSNSRREFFSGRPGLPSLRRAELESERAELALEKHRVISELKAAKSEQREGRFGVLVGILIRNCEALGLGDMVKEAKDEANALMSERGA